VGEGAQRGGALSNESAATVLCSKSLNNLAYAAVKKEVDRKTNGKRVGSGRRAGERHADVRCEIYSRADPAGLCLLENPAHTFENAEGW